jgi:hypothetical protein
MAIVKCRRCENTGNLGNTIRRVFIEGKLTTLCRDCLDLYNKTGKRRIPKEKA